MSGETSGRAAEWLQVQSARLSVELARRLTRQERIARLAYARAARRGFEPGHEHDDWLEAEREVDSLSEAGHTLHALGD
jgi:hypothetical protein